MTDCTGLLYTKKETELTWLILQDMEYDEVQTKKRQKQNIIIMSYSIGYTVYEKDQIGQ